MFGLAPSLMGGNPYVYVGNSYTGSGAAGYTADFSATLPTAPFPNP